MKGEKKITKQIDVTFDVLRITFECSNNNPNVPIKCNMCLNPIVYAFECWSYYNHLV